MMSLRGKVLQHRYILGDPIGEGGSATVYHAEDHHTHQHVAVKIIPLTDNDRDAIQMKATILRSLHHPTFPHFYQFYCFQHVAYVVMEYIEGNTLREYLDQHGPLSVDKSIMIISDLLSGLIVLHNAGLIHGDIKPENIMLTSQGMKLIDFGSACPISYSLEDKKQVSGTVDYSAPETLKYNIATPQTDLYSTGILWFELLCGQSPFMMDSQIASLYKSATESIPSLTQIDTHFPTQASALVSALTETDPHLRPPNVQTVVQLLSVMESSLSDEEKHFCYVPHPHAVESVSVTHQHVSEMPHQETVGGFDDDLLTTSFLERQMKHLSRTQIIVMTIILIVVLTLIFVGVAEWLHF